MQVPTLQEREAIMNDENMSKVQACESSGNMQPHMIPQMEPMWTWQGKKIQKQNYKQQYVSILLS